jgi:hypothetical protein
MQDRQNATASQSSPQPLPAAVRPRRSRVHGRDRAATVLAAPVCEQCLSARSPSDSRVSWVLSVDGTAGDGEACAMHVERRLPPKPPLRLQRCKQCRQQFREIQRSRDLLQCNIQDQGARRSPAGTGEGEAEPATFQCHGDTGLHNVAAARVTVCKIGTSQHGSKLRNQDPQEASCDVQTGHRQRPCRDLGIRLGRRLVPHSASMEGRRLASADALRRRPFCGAPPSCCMKKFARSAGDSASTSTHSTISPFTTFRTIQEACTKRGCCRLKGKTLDIEIPRSRGS